MVNKQWQQTASNIKSGIWMYTLGGIALGVLGFFESISYFGDLIFGVYAMFSDREDTASIMIFDTEDYLGFLFNAMLIFGYYLFYSSIVKFVRLQRDDADREAANKVKMSYVYLVISIVLGWVPLIGWLLRLIFVLISYIKLISGYSGLRRSQNLTELARRGAGILRTAAILMFIGGILGCIPILGSFLESIFTLISFFMVLTGWGRIKRGAPELTEEEARAAIEEENRIAAELPEPKLQGYWILAIVGITFIFSVVHLIYTHTLSEYDSLNYDTVGVIDMIHKFCLIALCVFILAYRKANISGWSAFAVVMMPLVNVGWIFYPYIINAICGETFTEDHYVFSEYLRMFLNVVYFSVWIIFLMRSRLSNTFKVVGFIWFCPFVSSLLTSLAYMIVWSSYYEYPAERIQTQQAYCTFLAFVEFLIMALLVWKNTQRVGQEEIIVIETPDEQSQE